MVVGTLFGGIAAALVRPKVTAEVQADVAQPPVEAQAETEQPLAEVDEDVAPGILRRGSRWLTQVSCVGRV